MTSPGLISRLWKERIQTAKDTASIEQWIGEAVERFFGHRSYRMSDSTGGMNNTTRKIRVDGRDYILRLYDTHQDMEKVLREQEILRQLTNVGEDRRLAFKVPEPASPVSGVSAARLAEGKLASLVHYIEGSAPNFREPVQAESFGAAVGQLSARLAELRQELGPDWEPAYPPYYRLDESFSMEKAARFCADPPQAFAREKDSLELLARELVRLHPLLPGMAELPHQLIHGDLNASNALVYENGSIAALLDFEFATWDLRAMEPAVCLWSLLPSRGEGHAGERLDGIVLDVSKAQPGQSGQDDQPGHNDQRGLPGLAADADWEPLAVFWRGYTRFGELGRQERNAIPDLMELRSLDVFLHFLGRYEEGVDGAEVLQGQIPDTAWRVRQIVDNRRLLLELLNQDQFAN